MDWDAIRSEFPITHRWAFFDHAAVAPLTAGARQAVCSYVDDMTENGDVNERQWVRRVGAVREMAGKLLNADPLDVAFVQNTSAGVGFVAEGYPWQSGDNVVIAEEEYPANVYPWMNLVNRGVEVRMTPTRDRRIWIDDIAARVDSRTRIVSLSYVEFASGFRNDLTAIGDLCHERGAHFFVDAIQGLGILPLDVQRMPIDFLAADGHKWLLGPEGAGIFYLRRELVEKLRPVAVGWHSVIRATDFSTIDFRLKPHAGRWENGTLNVAGITGLGASMEFLLSLGIENIGRRVLELTDYLCEKCQANGWDVYSSRRPEDRSAIVSICFPHADLKAVVQRCRDARIVINRRAGRLRVSPHCYNSVAEIDKLIDVLRTFS